MRQKISKLLIFAGIALLLVAGGFFAYNQIYDYNAGQRAQELLDQTLSDYGFVLPPLEELVYRPAPSTGETAAGESSSPALQPPNVIKPGVIYQSLRDIPDEFADIPEDAASSPPGADTYRAPTYTVIGILSMPTLGIQLPVIGECSDELLKISCCRISGIVTDKPIRLVIAGHRISRHFGALETLELDDQIAFTTMDNVTYYYSLSEKAEIHKTGGAEVLAATGWDITLLTCKVDNTMRTMLRFVLLGSS